MSYFVAKSYSNSIKGHIVSNHTTCRAKPDFAKDTKNAKNKQSSEAVVCSKMNLSISTTLICILFQQVFAGSKANCRNDTIKRSFGKILDEKFENLFEMIEQRYDIQTLKCPPDWIRIMNSCIRTSTESLAFNEAAEKCKEFDTNARLYEPRSKLHNQLVFALLKERNEIDNFRWIGVHDKHEEGL